MVLFLDIFSMSYGRILHYVLPYIIYHIQLFLDHYHVISCAIYPETNFVLPYIIYHIQLFLDHYHVISCAIYPEINFVLPYVIYHIQLFLDHYHVISCAIMCYLSRNHFLGGISMVRDEAPLSCWC